MPPQPPKHGTGNGVLGVLPASSVPSAPPSQAMAYADPAPRPQPQAVQQNGAIKPVAAHTGWIIQVGALESESEARQRIEAARNQAHGLLAKADPFTEPVVAKGDRKLFRARFAGLDRDQAEAVCRASEALRHFLHHRPQLIGSAGKIGAPQTSRQDFAVKTVVAARSAIDHAGQRRAVTGRQPERNQKQLGFVAFGGVAGVSCDACEAEFPWPRLHGRRGTSTPPGRDAVSS